MYFIKITSNYNPKNQLQKYLHDQLTKLECLTIENPDELKKHLEKLVFRANLTYKRCTPAKAYFAPSYIKGDYSAGISELIQLSLYNQRGVFGSSEQHQLAAVQRQEESLPTLFAFPSPIN